MIESGFRPTRASSARNSITGMRYSQRMERAQARPFCFNEAHADLGDPHELYLSNNWAPPAVGRAVPGFFDYCAFAWGFTALIVAATLCAMLKCSWSVGSVFAAQFFRSASSAFSASRSNSFTTFL
jgi:hypothetical protein